ncbi:MAG: hypothetical protein OQL21_00040, partial [Gammaproteobacteria bacterium]|nr:hypothetical protein [Gammaproteobacteria bacterium]
MDDTLQPISIKLSRLEKTLLEAYSRTRAESSSELLYIVLPREQARSHLATLKTLHDELLGTADSGKLQLVTDL